MPLILGIVILFVVSMAGVAGVLYASLRLFRFPRANFRKVFLAALAGYVVMIGFGYVSSYFGLLLFGGSQILGFAGGFAIFWLILREREWSLKQIIGGWILFYVALSIVSVMVILGVRRYMIEPIMYQGDAMPSITTDFPLWIQKIWNTYDKGDIVAVKVPGSTDIAIRRIVNIPGEESPLGRLGEKEFFAAADNASTSAPFPSGKVHEGDIIGVVVNVK